MSAEARPINATQFALAVEDLPIENIYAKAHEIQNSIDHLRQSNSQLQEYSDSIKNDVTLEASTRPEGDRDCLDAIRENGVVIERQVERIELLKREVERRGGRWHEDTEPLESATNGANGTTANAQTTNGAVASTTSRPRLTDEELRWRLEEQMASGDDEGMHL